MTEPSIQSDGEDCESIVAKTFPPVSPLTGATCPPLKQLRSARDRLFWARTHGPANSGRSARVGAYLYLDTGWCRCCANRSTRRRANTSAAARRGCTAGCAHFGDNGPECDQWSHGHDRANHNGGCTCGNPDSSDGGQVNRDRSAGQCTDGAWYPIWLGRFGRGKPNF